MKEENYSKWAALILSVLFALAAATAGWVFGQRSTPQPTPQIAASSTNISFATGTIAMAALPPITSVLDVEGNTTGATCFYQEKNACVVTLKDFKADIQILKAIRSGNFSISGNNISIPIGNGSSTDLMSVLNYIQSQLNNR